MPEHQGRPCYFHPGNVEDDLRCHGPRCGIMVDYWSCCGKEIGCYGSSNGKEFDDRKPVAGCKQAATSHQFTETAVETGATTEMNAEDVAAASLPPSAANKVAPAHPIRQPSNLKLHPLES